MQNMRHELLMYVRQRRRQLQTRTSSSMVGRCCYRVVRVFYVVGVVMKTAAQYLEQGLSILSERGQQYGSNNRECSFPQVADAFNAITCNELSGSDVCMILAILKLVRQSAQPDRLHEDSLIDGVNYMALYAEMVGKELSE